jgi:hypothetical protein
LARFALLFYEVGFFCRGQRGPMLCLSHCTYRTRGLLEKIPAIQWKLLCHSLPFGAAFKSRFRAFNIWAYQRA